MQAYKLGNPLHDETSLGPVISVTSAERIRKQVAGAGWSLGRGRIIDIIFTLVAVSAGAKALIPEDHFPAAKK